MGGLEDAIHNPDGSLMCWGVAQLLIVVEGTCSLLFNHLCFFQVTAHPSTRKLLVPVW